MRDKYDIVIIGSGIGGLVSAALLSKAGKKVLIIEKEPKPGGYLSEFKRGDFAFEVSLHLLNGCSKNQFAHNVLDRCGVLNKIKLLKPKHLYRSIFPDYDLNIPQGEIGRYKEMLIDLFPQSENGIKNIFKDMPDIYNDVENQDSSIPITPLMSRFFREKCSSVLDKHINDDKLKAILCQLWMYFGLPPSKLRAIDFWYPWFDYTHYGGYYLEGGSAALTAALVECISDKGVSIRFNRTVDRILVDKNICYGVEVGNDKIMCDAVISNVDLKKTFYELIGRDKLLPMIIKGLDTVQPSISAFEIFLGLNIDLKSAYPDEYEIFVNPSYDIEEQYEDSVENRATRAPFAIAIYSNIDKTCVAAGKSIVVITMLSGYDHWAVKSRKEYLDKKKEVAQILIERACRVIPEIKSNIAAKVVATPLTFERYTSNSKGAIYGYSWTKNNRREIRPNEMRGIKNIYFASAWERQGSGIVKVLRSANKVSDKILSS